MRKNDGARDVTNNVANIRTNDTVPTRGPISGPTTRSQQGDQYQGQRHGPNRGTNIRANDTVPIVRLTRGWTSRPRWASSNELHCTENLKQIFPEKELRGHSSNSYIHFSVCDLYVYSHDRSDLSAAGKYGGGPMVRIYIWLTDTWMWKLGLRPRNSFSGNIYIDISLPCGDK